MIIIIILIIIVTVDVTVDVTVRSRHVVLVGVRDVT